MIVRTISRHLLLLFINLLFLGNSSALVEEQAYVRADIAWCVNSDCFVDGLWSSRRSPECIYERRYSLFSAVCEIDTLW